MASGDNSDTPKHLTYAKSDLPLIGAMVDFIETSFRYIKHKTFVQAEKLNAKSSRVTLSATFMTTVCLMLGFVSNVKFEVVTFDEEPLANDLHFMLMSKDDKLYIDDIDVTRVMWCIEASDVLVLFISCLLIWNSSNVAPTAGALLYTTAVVSGEINPLFLTAFSFLFLLEARMWLEVARLVRARWDRREQADPSHDSEYELETLWSNDDVQSVEVRNYVY
ncbi:uncharacterized protein LOC119189082 isoform X2 [Manduca sexta]|uniref:uncharacterized protein LOC119189082 isoform X2 n=1 Tax=Manduca sexta TaxID=7130 RepID=UPI00188F5B35|nr:uncharacterized protein LOC119189082 isoform X2 [Manduca sexta]